MRQLAFASCICKHVVRISFASDLASLATWAQIIDELGDEELSDLRTIVRRSALVSFSMQRKKLMIKDITKARINLAVNVTRAKMEMLAEDVFTKAQEALAVLITATSEAVTKDLYKHKPLLRPGLSARCQASGRYGWHPRRAFILQTTSWACITCWQSTWANVALENTPRAEFLCIGSTRETQTNAGLQGRNRRPDTGRLERGVGLCSNRLGVEPDS